MSFSIDGIVSGFDTAKIIDGLVSIQKRQVDQFTSRKTEVARRQTAFKGVESRLATLRSSMSRLNRTVGSVFDARSATSSNESLVDIAASSGAQPGTFSLRVNSLAAAHQTATQGFAAPSSSITTGTIQIRTGSRQAETITVDGTNNTVESLVAAINTQSSQVSASLIRDAASGEYRMLLASRNTGTDNAIQITNNLAADTGGAIRPDFANTTVQAASNAQVTFGSGAGAITAEYSSNRIDNLVDGVTLNLLGADPGKDVILSVQADHSAVATAVDDFVKEYNSLIGYVNEQTAFTAETGAAGLLLGNRSVQSIRSALESVVNGSIPGLTGNLRRLSQIGVQFTDKGTLTFNESQLTKVLSGQESGIAPAEVRRLFGMSATSSTSGIEFVLGSSRTRETSSPIEVDITQAARQATALAAKPLESPTVVIDSSNREFSLSVDGVASGTLLLTEGTYTETELADHLQSVINNASALGGRQVTVSVNAGQLQIRTANYGSSATLGSFGGSSLNTLGFNPTDGGSGQDVVGRFLVNGQVETARGTGRLLVGDSANANTADLQLRILLTDDQVVAGHEGTLSVSRGVTARLDQRLGEMLDASRGILQTVNQQFDDQIESIDSSIRKVDAATTAKREYLTLQFTNLERILGELQSTSGFLSSQLSSLGSLGRNRN